MVDHHRQNHARRFGRASRVMKTPLHRFVILTAIAYAAAHAAGRSADMIDIDTQMAQRSDRWTFVGGAHPWKQRADGVMLPPIWAILGEADAPGYFANYGAYADDLTREDYAFLSGEVLSGIDLSVDFQIRYASVANMAVAFRAQDSRRMYVVVVNDMGRKGYSFDVKLWRQDEHGFRHHLASGIVPHPETPDRIRQSGARTYEDWLASCHGWSTLRVRAVGPSIQVSIDGQEAFVCEDETYAAGPVALLARWAIPFRHFKLKGVQARLPEPWRRAEEGRHATTRTADRARSVALRRVRQGPRGRLAGRAGHDQGLQHPELLDLSPRRHALRLLRVRR